MIRNTLVLAALLIGMGPLASAQDDESKKRPDRKPTPEQIKRFDKNGDGKLDETEREAARKAIQERRKKGDARRRGGDDDAKGKGGQRRRGGDDAKGKGDQRRRGGDVDREALRKRFDKNGDGKLDEAERAAARKAMEERRKKGGEETGRRRGGDDEKGRRRRGGGPDREAMIKRFDANKDGKLDETERAALRKHVEAERAKRREEGNTPPQRKKGSDKKQRGGGDDEQES